MADASTSTPPKRTGVHAGDESRPAPQSSRRDARPANAIGGRPAIIVVRHGRPALERSTHYDWRGYQEWWRRYDAGGLETGQTPPAALLDQAAGADVILSSPLARSLETAHMVAGGLPITTNEVFVEAPLPPPPLPGVRLRPGPWGVVARITWWFGASGGLESRRAAERRADAAVKLLLETAGDDQVVLVCAHGWFNRMMRPVLLGAGWRCVVDGRDSHWSFRRFEPAPR